MESEMSYYQSSRPHKKGAWSQEEGRAAKVVPDCDFDRAFDQEILQTCGRAPVPPDGWIPYNVETGTGMTHGPGAFVLNEHQAANPFFSALAHLAWTAGRGYMIDWLWAVADTAKMNADIKLYEAANKRKRYDQAALQFAAEDAP
jgi:hypothetical protein